MSRLQPDMSDISVCRTAMLDGDHKNDQMTVIDCQDDTVVPDPARIERDFFVALEFFDEQPRLSFLCELV